MKNITIELNANEASGEAYWRKRCDVVEAELTRLLDENERLKSAMRVIIAMCSADEGTFPGIAGEAQMALMESNSEQKPRTCV